MSGRQEEKYVQNAGGKKRDFCPGLCGKIGGAHHSFLLTGSAVRNVRSITVLMICAPCLVFVNNFW